MSFFEKIFGNKKSNTKLETENTQTTTSSVNLQKTESLKKVNLRKECVSKICLEKRELNDLTCRVAVVMDYSGSMDTLYYNGTVQSILERLLPLALKFDDNGELETWIFDSSFHRLNDININNYFNYLKNENVLKKYDMGSTYYAPVMADVVKKYTKESPSNLPTLVLFLTDGDNFDKSETKKILSQASKYPIFWQFVGIGKHDYKFLKNLDTMTGRHIDNANFFVIEDINRISDDELYKKLLNEYPSWINEAKSKNIIK